MSFMYSVIDDLNIRISELNIKHRHEVLSKKAVGVNGKVTVDDIQVISNRIARATQASSFSDEIAYLR